MRKIVYNCLNILVFITLVSQTFAFPFYEKTRTNIAITKNKLATNRSSVLPPPPVLPPVAKNGIHVNEVKVLDDRSIAQNLQQIEANLANLRFFDQTSLSSAIGVLQGASMNSSSLAASVTMQASPSLETITTTESGATKTPTEKVVTTEKEGSNTPTAPTLSASNSVFVPPSAFRISAQDLLAEQMAMTYQVINLRTFLQRSLSDRWLGGTYSKTTKDQQGVKTTSSEKFSGARAVALLGFEISVKNPEEYKDAVAEVQIEIANKDSSGTNKDGSSFTAHYDQTPSLIMQSPIEKTYNVATITKDSKSFSLGAAVQVLNIGLAAEKKSETLYLVRDNDTVAFSDSSFAQGEFDNTGCNVVSDKAISFGWQFRPVLGRRSVEPGPRKVMAMISLPNATFLSYTGTLRVKTRWLKFDRKRKVVGRQIGTSVSQCLKDLEIPSTQDIKNSLRPIGVRPNWTNIGSGLAAVTLEGENFLTGTGVIIGDTTYNSSMPGFQQSGEDQIKFVVPIQKLAQFSDIYLSSDYGGLQPIQNSLLAETPSAAFDPKTQAGWGAKISSVTATSDDGQNVKLIIKMLPKITGARPILSSDTHHAVILIGDQAFDTLNSKVTDDSADTNAKLIELKIPFSLADSAGRLSVKDFFWGTDYSSSFPIDLSGVFIVKKVDILATEGNATWLAVRGNNFDNDTTKIIIGGKEYTKADTKNFTFRSSSLIELKADIAESDLKNIKQITITDGSIYLAAQFSSPTPKLTVQIDKAGVVKEGEVKDIKIEGANLSNVSFVLFVNERIPFAAGGDGKSATLSVTRELARTRGNQQLNFVLKDGTVVSYLLTISPP